MASEIYTSEMWNPPHNPDGATASPSGYAESLDKKNTDISDIKRDIYSKYPQVKNISIYRPENRENDGVIIRMDYKWSSIEIKKNYQDIISTLSDRPASDLSPFIQSLTSENNGIYNLIVQEIKKRGLKKVSEWNPDITPPNFDIV